MFWKHTPVRILQCTMVTLFSLISYFGLTIITVSQLQKILFKTLHIWYLFQRTDTSVYKVLWHNAGARTLSLCLRKVACNTRSQLQAPQQRKGSYIRYKIYTVKFPLHLYKNRYVAGKTTRSYLEIVTKFTTVSLINSCISPLFHFFSIWIA